MFNSTKRVLGLSALSALVAAGLYWWWARLTIATSALCVTGNPPAGLDCVHGNQFYGAIGFAALTGVLIIIAIVRGIRTRRTKRAVA